MVIRAIIEWDEEAQSYPATCPELNFVSSCGETQEEAIANLQDAITLMLEPLPDNLLTTLFNAETRRTAIVPVHTSKVLPLGTLKSIEKQANIKFE